jgi:hypothetical protein
LSFFFAFRKVLGTVVGEKEQGMKMYLEIGGCSKLSYYLSFLLSEIIPALVVYH